MPNSNNRKAGVSNAKPPGVCMVVGCERTSIYRCTGRVMNNRTLRGYCATHKSYATGISVFRDKGTEDYDGERIVWEPKCADWEK